MKLKPWVVQHLSFTFIFIIVPLASSIAGSLLANVFLNFLWGPQ